MFSAILSVFSASLLVNWVEPCMKISRPNRPPNMDHGLPYDDHKNYQRKLYESQCECGVDSDVQGKDWYVYVHVQTSNSTNRTCAGTVISDNMVVTSHHCFALEGHMMQAYEAWSPYPQERIHTVARADLVHITTVFDDQITPEYIEYVTVKDIIYNLRYGPAAPLGQDVASDADIALVIIEGSFFLPYDIDEGNPTPKWLRGPVCIPAANVEDSPPIVAHRYGFYLGIGSELQVDPTPEERFVNEVVILGGSECDKEQSFGSYSHRDSLCIRYRAPPPIFPGGPLMTTNSDGLFGLLFPHKTGRFHTSFLVGVSTTAIKRPLGTPLTYTYFGNVLKNIKYIEKIAEMYNSSWCSTPVFNETSGKATDADAGLQMWEWEHTDARKLAAGRKKDETLECIRPRISNGQTAIPYQFGWQIRLVVYDTFLCGGSIINDRWNQKNPKAAKTLQKLTLPIRSLQDCARNTREVVTKSMLCAGTFNQSYDSTMGDSGGPLVIDYPGEKSKLLQVGIVSFGLEVEGAQADRNGYVENVMGMYTNLEKFIPFVDYYSRKYGGKWCKY